MNTGQTATEATRLSMSSTILKLFFFSGIMLCVCTKTSTFCFFGRSQLSEGEKMHRSLLNWQKKKKRKKDRSYCLLLLERGSQSLSGLFIVVAVFRVFFFFSLLCAVSMDSSKVGKCRIACCSCFQGEREPNKNNLTHTHIHTHTITISSHWKTHRAPTFNRNVSFFLCFCGGFPPYTAGNNHCIHTLFALKAWWWISSVSPLVCLTIAPIRVFKLLHCGAEVLIKHKTGVIQGRGNVYLGQAVLIWQVVQTVVMSPPNPHAHTRTHAHKQQKLTLLYDVNLSAFWIQLGATH